MDFSLSEQQQAIDDGVRKVCARFDDSYWTDCDTEARFPHEFHRAMADGGWLGITMPEAYGGAGPDTTSIATFATKVAGGAAASVPAATRRTWGGSPLCRVVTGCTVRIG